MNEKQQQLAALIARRIFERGDEPNNPCTRIQFKGGYWPLKETDQGGIAEEPLARFIESVLAETRALKRERA